MFASVFVLPVMTVILLLFISSVTTDNSKDTYKIFVLDNGISTSSAEYCDGNTIEIVPVKETGYHDAVNNNDITEENVVIKLNSDGSALIYYNSTNSISETLSYFCRQYIETAYDAMFLSINRIEVFDTEIVDYKKTDFNRMIALFLPYMLILLLFTNVSNYTCDTVAGEKERGVFSKTILAPVSTSAIITGKLLSSAICGLFGSLVYIIIIVMGSLIADTFFDIDILGIDITEFSGEEALLIFIYAVLLCLLLSALAVLCSLYAKNAKEARSLLIPFMGISIVLSLASVMRAGVLSVYNYMIPIYNLCVIIQDILLGNEKISNMITVGGTLLLLTLIIFAVTVKSFKNENIRY